MMQSNNFINLKKPWGILLKLNKNYDNTYDVLLSDFTKGLFRILINYSLDKKYLDKIFLLPNSYSEKYVTLGKFEDIVGRNIKSETCDLFIYQKYNKSWTINEKLRINTFLKHKPLLMTFVIKNSFILINNVMQSVFYLNGFFYHLAEFIWPKCEYNKCMKLYINPGIKCVHKELIDKKIQQLVSITNIDVNDAIRILKLNNYDILKCINNII